MTTGRGSGFGRPFRRLTRWWRDTPTNEVATTLMGVGVLLIIAAAVIALLALNG